MALRRDVWPLALFTLFVQAAVGATAILWTTDLLASVFGPPEVTRELSRVTVLALGPMVVLGILGLMIYLRHNADALGKDPNTKKWYRRELISLTAFFLLGGVYALVWFTGQDMALRLTVGALVIMCGVLGLVSSAKLYQGPDLTTWDHLRTLVVFIITAFLLGAATVGAIFAVYTGLHPGSKPILDGIVRAHYRFMVLTVVASGAVSGLILYQWQDLVDQAYRSRFDLWLWIRHGLGFAGAVIVALWIWYLLNTGAGLESVNILVLLTGFMVGAGEFVDRLLFFFSGCPFHCRRGR